MTPEFATRTVDLSFEKAVPLVVTGPTGFLRADFCAPRAHASTLEWLSRQPSD